MLRAVDAQVCGERFLAHGARFVERSFPFENIRKLEIDLGKANVIGKFAGKKARCVPDGLGIRLLPYCRPQPVPRRTRLAPRARGTPHRGYGMQQYSNLRSRS